LENEDTVLKEENMVLIKDTDIIEDTVLNGYTGLLENTVLNGYYSKKNKAPLKDTKDISIGNINR
jgi:hypothetical protein